MDEMMLSIKTPILKGFIAKIIANMIKKKIGFKVNLRINELDIRKNGDSIVFKIGAEGSTDSSNLFKAVRMAEKEMAGKE